MRLPFIITLLLGFGFATLTYGQQQISNAEVRTLDGQTVSLNDYLQKADLTIISFWATWCKPCQAELDAIADLYPDWQENFDAQMVAITIDTQRQLAKVPGLLSTKGWEYVILSDANNVMRNQLGFQAIPQTYIVDKEGNVLYSHSGYTAGGEYELEEKLEELSGK
ncbi:MAG: TlpA family protein disulfide reductase [Bacteroidetes bacterium]|nr:MAG: TlpA family protein disulfide reductase [Bacteroidota bacterium]